MTGLLPLLESSSDDLERALLHSAKRDVPGRAGLQDTALALGLGISTATALANALSGAETLAHPAAAHAAASVGTLSANSVLSAGGTLSLTSAQVSLVMVGKYLVGGALVSFLAMATLDGTLGMGSGGTASERALSSVRAARVINPPLAVKEPAIDTGNAAPTFVEATGPSVGRELEGSSAKNFDRPTPKRAGRGPAPEPASPKLLTDGALPFPVPGAPAVSTKAPPAPPATRASSLAAELELLDRARALLSSGDAEGARRLLDQYATSRPSGVLAQEAALLRVRLLSKLGDHGAAAALARQLMAQNPESRHVDWLRHLATE